MRQKIAQALPYFAFALLLMGLVGLVYGAYEYLYTDREMSEVDAQMALLREDVAAAAQEISNPEGLVLSTIELNRQRNDLVERQNTAIRVFGVAVALLGAAWLLRDLGKSLGRRGPEGAQTTPDQL